MMRLLFLLSLFSALISAHSAEKKPIVIAVVDTGFGKIDRFPKANLCKYGHKDFSNHQLFYRANNTVDDVPIDVNGHGTNIVGVIQDNIKNPNQKYCVVVLKYYTDQQTGQENLNAALKAFKYALNIKADVINFSGGGPEFNDLEFNAIKKFINSGGIFVTAAGNDNENIDEEKTAYYPASYNLPLIVVGSTNFYGKKSSTSNYGKKVNRWEVGEHVTGFGLTMSGTSQATATVTGKIVTKMKK